MRNKYTWTLCSKVWDIQNIIKTKKWGCREEDIREIEQLLWYIHQDWQAMEDKLYERKDEVEELKKEIKRLNDTMQEEVNYAVSCSYSS